MIDEKDIASVREFMAGRKVYPGEFIVGGHPLVQSYTIDDNLNISVVLKGAIKEIEIKGKLSFTSGEVKV